MDAGGCGRGGRRPGQAAAEITCQTAHSLLTSTREDARLTACFLQREFGGAGGTCAECAQHRASATRRVSSARAEEAGASPATCAPEFHGVFYVGHVVPQRGPRWKRSASKSVNARAKIAHEKSQRRG